MHTDRQRQTDTLIAILDTATGGEVVIVFHRRRDLVFSQYSLCVVLFVQATSFNERDAFLVAFRVLQHLLSYIVIFCY